MSSTEDTCWEIVNEVTLKFNHVLLILNNEDFDDLDFSESGDLDDMLLRNEAMRNRIFIIFETNYKPDVYAVIILLLLYKINPSLANSFTCWNQASEHLIFNFNKNKLRQTASQYELKCLCGCKITEVFKIQQDKYYSIVGNICIQKTSLYNQQELYYILRVNCSICYRNCPRPPPFDFTKEICKRCLNKQNKIHK